MYVLSTLRLIRNAPSRYLISIKPEVEKRVKLWSLIQSDLTLKISGTTENRK